MKVLLIPDAAGWALEFISRGVQKHSKHNVTVLPKGYVSPSYIKSNDATLFLGVWTWDSLMNNESMRNETSKKPFIVYCTGKSFNPVGVVKSGGKWAVCSERLIGKSKAAGVEDTTYLRIGVDTEVFKPMPKPPSANLRVGLAGRGLKGAFFKRLMPHLKYPVKVMNEEHWSVLNRSRESMVKFYNSIDVYMITACQPEGAGAGLTVLESMSCGLPVLSTDPTGDVAPVLPEEWIVPIFTGSDKCMHACMHALVAEGFNKRLAKLDNNRELMAEVGRKNGEWILKNRSWKICVEDWDQLFDELYNS